MAKSKLYTAWSKADLKTFTAKNLFDEISPKVDRKLRDRIFKKKWADLIRRKHSELLGFTGGVFGDKISDIFKNVTLDNGHIISGEQLEKMSATIQHNTSLGVIDALDQNLSRIKDIGGLYEGLLGRRRLFNPESFFYGLRVIPYEATFIWAESRFPEINKDGRLYDHVRELLNTFLQQPYPVKLRNADGSSLKDDLLPPIGVEKGFRLKGSPLEASQVLAFWGHIESKVETSIAEFKQGKIKPNPLLPSKIM